MYIVLKIILISALSEELCIIKCLIALISPQQQDYEAEEEKMISLQQQYSLKKLYLSYSHQF